MHRFFHRFRKFMLKYESVFTVILAVFVLCLAVFMAADIVGWV